ncbi:MAG: class I SAM-dependent methyltransferase [Thermoleophilia bacterium]
MSTSWDERFDTYRDSQAQVDGADLDSFVEWCEPEPDLTILDVATGTGDVARRLRACGCSVTTCDETEEAHPDVVCPAEDLPFDDDSFDVVVCRLAAYHVANAQAAINEMARVSRGPVVLEANLRLNDNVELAERLRDPAYRRCYSEDEWIGLCEWAGLHVPVVGLFLQRHVISEWLAAAGCVGETAARVRELLAPFSDADGLTWTSTRLLLRAVRSA